MIHKEIRIEMTHQGEGPEDTVTLPCSSSLASH